MTTLFIYGTLKKGCCRNHILKNAKFLRSAMTTPFYRLYNTGSFPALVNDGNGTSIIGELWEVDDDLMNYLDRIEGVHFGMYAREEVEIMSDGVVPPIPKPIIAYVFQMDTEGMDDCGSSWKE